MNYLGHFSFDELGTEGEPRHGYFTCAVAAEGPEEALNQFREHIIKVKEKGEMFAEVLAVYVEDIMEILEFPKTPIITRFQSSEGEFPESVSFSLPDGDPEAITAYAWAGDKSGDGADDEEEGYVETDPFIDFQS